MLTDVKLADLASLRRALKILHDEYHVPNVVISSIPSRPWLAQAVPPGIRPTSSDDSDADYLLSIVSSTAHTIDETPTTVHTRYIPCIPGYFSGVGDLFSALVLAHYDPSDASKTRGTTGASTAISRAVAQAIAKTHAILSLTHEHSLGLPEDERLPTDEELDAREPDRVVRRMKGRELRLIQGQDIIRHTGVQDMDVWSGFWDEA